MSLRRYPVTSWVTLACRLVLGVVLVYAGAEKLPDLQASVLSVRLYQLAPVIPFEWTSFIGYALPVVEVALGLLLVVGMFTRWSALAGALMMAVYIAAIASVWARGISIDCGCFSAGAEVDPSQTQYPQEILRDTGLLLLGAWAVWRPRAPYSIDNWLFAASADEDLPDDLADDDTDEDEKDG